MKRWGSSRVREEDRRYPRKPFSGKAQFSFDELYISPFTHELIVDEYGRKEYKPLTKNFTPTGVNVLDAYIQALYSRNLNVSEFCARYEATTAELAGLIYLLTGISNIDFRNRWILRNAENLLRYTDMSITEVARRSGAGTRNNLYFIYEREMNCSPTTRREQLRKDGDLGRFKIMT